MIPWFQHLWHPRVSSETTCFFTDWCNNFSGSSCRNVPLPHIAWSLVFRTTEQESMNSLSLRNFHYPKGHYCMMNNAAKFCWYLEMHPSPLSPQLHWPLCASTLGKHLSIWLSSSGKHFGCILIQALCFTINFHFHIWWMRCCRQGNFPIVQVHRWSFLI